MSKKFPVSVQKNEYDITIGPRLSYCLFIDILGFSYEVKEANEKQIHKEHFFRIHDAFEKATASLRGESEFSPRGHTDNCLWQIKLFSDNVVLGIPVSMDERARLHHEGLFGTIIREVIQFQMFMSLEGWFLRGGWAIGGLYMDEIMIYGEALINAHTIESKRAVNPLIMLDDLMLDVVKKHLSFYTSIEHSPHYQHLLITQDGSYFINYLIGLTYSDDVDEEGLNMHKNQILSKYNNIYDREEFPKKQDILLKYKWLIDYHNFFIDYFLGEYFNSYKIDKHFKNKFHFLNGMS